MFVLKKKDTPSKSHLTIDDLYNGDIFIFDGGVFLMIDNHNTNENLLSSSEVYCLNLEENELSVFNVKDYVTLIDKDIIIDYTNEDLKEWVD